MALAPSAATISVCETLELLDGPFLAFAEGVAEDRYALWLGSGISFGRVDGLKKVVPRVIEFLRAQVVANRRAGLRARSKTRSRSLSSPTRKNVASILRDRLWNGRMRTQLSAG